MSDCEPNRAQELFQEVYTLRLKPAQRLILSFMARAADTDGQFRKGTKYLARVSEYGELQVKRILEALREAGLIEMTTKHSGRRPSAYKFHLDKGEKNLTLQNEYLEMIGIQNEPSNLTSQNECLENIGIQNELLTHSHHAQNGQKSGRAESLISYSSQESLPRGKEKDSVKPVRPRNLWYDVIFEVWGYTGGRNGDWEKLLRGNAIKKGYREYNLDPAMDDPDELRQWKRWYMTVKSGGGGRKDAQLLRAQEKVQSSIGEFRAYRQNPPASANGARPPMVVQRPTDPNWKPPGDYLELAKARMKAK
jgi:hypothetical protein